MVGALVGLSAPLAASADTATTRPAADRPFSVPASVPLHVNGDEPKHGKEPIRWLDSTIVRDTPGGATNFAVSANNGAPFVFDPRSTPLGWQSLRRVPGSRGAFVTNITATEDANSAPGQARLAIVARTSDSNIFFTICNVNNPLPQAPAPLPCSPWERLRS
ncbi:hypothetical protein [Microbispora sp. NPDC049633]|uniref:hypothetical protein n=1 Tax=Microbispora sp. NPDC049633 TaxID=3154355 RepID=UPI0034377592